MRPSRSSTTNYRDLGDIKLPPLKRHRKDKDSEKTYPVEVVDADDTGGVKIHYVGYSSRHDEWRRESDLVRLSPPSPDLLRPISLYEELSYAIKAALKPSGPSKDPIVRLEIPFDLLSFNGGETR